MTYHPYDLGSALMSGTVPQAPQPVTGWTSPHVIYDRMRQLNVAAISLDQSIATHSKSETLKKSWTEWFANWKAFFEKHQGTYQRLGNVFSTDELAAQVESYRLAFEGFHSTYLAEPGAPPPPLPPPPKPPPPSSQTKSDDGKDEGGFSVPWWGWMLGGVALVGLGYFAYRQVRSLQAKKEALERNVLPMVLPAPVAQAAMARDPLPYSQPMVYVMPGQGGYHLP